eukprot:7574453-Pyramimonas_sp.AAC.2
MEHRLDTLFPLQLTSPSPLLLFSITFLKGGWSCMVASAAAISKDLRGGAHHDSSHSSSVCN